MSKQQPPRLGRGLASLISTPEIHQNQSPVQSIRGVGNTAPTPHSPPETTNTRITALMLPIQAIRANPRQPRKTFVESGLSALAESIKTRGTIQPILVRQSGDGYELIAGERRLRAAVMAGLTEIPAIIRPTNDDELLELALIENIQRQDLNPVERARAYQSLATTRHLSHEQIAERMNEDRATVTNYLRLLSLHETVLEKLASGDITIGHAKAMLAISDKNSQNKLLDQIVRGGWSVRQTEMYLARIRETKPQRHSPQTRPAVQNLEKLLEGALGTRVHIHEGRRRHTGRITIEYYTLDDFQRVITRLGLGAEQAPWAGAGDQ